MATATLTPEKRLTLRKTTLGGALNATRLIQQLPDTTRLSVDLYLLLGPAGDLLTCNDPEVTSVMEWKEKSTDLLNRFENLLNSWRAIAAA